jgi:hypothetical protein
MSSVTTAQAAANRLFSLVAMATFVPRFQKCVFLSAEVRIFGHIIITTRLKGTCGLLNSVDPPCVERQ